MTTRDTRYRKRPSSARVATRGHSETVAAVRDTEDALRFQRIENECAQFLRVQQKLTGRKTTAEYARIRLVPRPDDNARKRNLHQNGAKTARDRLSASTRPLSDSDHDSQSTRPHTARGSFAPPPPTARVRPQSARPERRNSASDVVSAVAGQRVSVALLEKCYYNPIPLTTHLSVSRSAPRLQAALQYSTAHPKRRDSKHHDEATSCSLPPAMETVDGSGRKRIVVNMRHLEIREYSDGDSDDDITAIRTATATKSVAGQRHERDATRDSPWTDTD